MDDISKITLFRDVVELGGFTAAAARHDLNHSTVSRHVKTLERQLGVQLLERTTRTMSVTAPGQVVLEHGRRIGVTLEDMHRRLEELRGDVVGELRIGSLVHVGQHIVQPATAIFLDRFPGVEVTLLLEDGPLAFHRKALDLALHVGLPAEGSLIARKLLDNDVVLAATPALLDRAGPLAHPQELESYPTVAYASGGVEVTAWAYTEGGVQRTVTVKPALRTSDGNSLLEAVRGGLGVGYLSAFAAREDLAAGRLVQVLPDVELPPYDPVYVLTAPSEFLSPRLEAFKACLLEVAEGLAAP